MAIDFGRGLITPFQRDGKGDFANTTGPDLLRADIAELLGIVGPSSTERGELPWRDEVGTRLVNLKHRRLYGRNLAGETIRGLAESMTSETIRRFESRARVGRSKIEVEETTLRVIVNYVPLGYNTDRTQEAVIEIRR